MNHNSFGCTLQEQEFPLILIDDDGHGYIRARNQSGKGQFRNWMTHPPVKELILARPNSDTAGTLLKLCLDDRFNQLVRGKYAWIKRGFERLTS